MKSAIRLAAIGAAIGANPSLAANVFPLNDAWLAAGTMAVTGSVKSGPTKLTLGLDTLSAEYQAYKQAVVSATARQGAFVSTRTMARVVGEGVIIDAIAADDPQALRATLEALGAEVTAVAGRIVSARLPLDQLPELEGV